MEEDDWVVIESPAKSPVGQGASSSSSAAASNSASGWGELGQQPQRRPIQISSEKRNALRKSGERDISVKGKEEEEEEDEDESNIEKHVTEEVLELINEREADEALEKNVLEALRATIAETQGPRFTSEEEILMEIIASENFGFDANPFNDPSRVANDEAIARSLQEQERVTNIGWLLEQQRQQTLAAVEQRELQRTLQLSIQEALMQEKQREEELKKAMMELSQLRKKKDDKTGANSFSVVTWGKDNGYGVLLGHSNSQGLPQSPNNLPNVRIVQVAVGKGHSVIVDESGEIYTWGLSPRGQLGANVSASRIPIQTFCTRINIRKIACGDHHTVCVTDSGKVLAFGDNSCNQLGTNAFAQRAEPYLLKVPENITDVACGAFHSVLISETGNLYTFGSNEKGQLGVQSDAPKVHCVVDPQIYNKGVLGVSCGEDFTVAIVSASRHVYAWGNNADGRLGLGKCGNHYSNPQWIKAFENYSIVQVACGKAHSLALTSNGFVFSWGCGGEGQTGQGNFKNTSSPQMITSLLGVPINNISCGEFISIAITDDGDIYGWGLARNNQLGDIGTKSISSPQIIASLANRKVRQLSCGAFHCAAVVDNLSNLASSMLSIFNNKEEQPDIIIICQGKNIYAHRAILAQRCLYFKVFLQKQQATVEKNMIAINISSVRYDVLLHLLRFLYTESTDFPEELVTEIIALGEKLKVPHIAERIAHPSLYTERLGAELMQIINEPEYANVVFKFEDDPTQELFAHKAILGARSMYFRNMFKWSQKSNELSATKQEKSREEIAVSFSFSAMKSIMQYIYCSKADVNEDNVVELFEASRQYSLYALSTTCETLMLGSIDPETVIPILNLAILHESSNIVNGCIQYIAEHYQEIASPDAPASILEDWIALKEQHKEICKRIESKRSALTPAKQKNIMYDSWAYWDKKISEQDLENEYLYDEEQDEFDANYEDDDDDDDEYDE